MKTKKYFLVILILVVGCACHSVMALSASSAMLSATYSTNESVRTITGTVIDELTKEPLIGAVVQVKGSEQIGVVTDMDGKYTLNNVTSRTVLLISYLGYRSKEVEVGNLAVVNIVMLPQSEELDEVVIVGAGTQKKVSVTGSISTVSGLTLRTPSSSLTNNLAGKLAGVISVQGSGEPGAASEFFIRGVGTFGGRATPLILLDDIEISAGDLDRIPAENIKSFSVLKDASATAIYGARGANGVMLITTKSGAYNTKATVNVTLENSYFRPVNQVAFADGATFMTMANEAITTRDHTATPRYTKEQIFHTRNHTNLYVYPDTDWYSLLFKESNMNQRANINVQGGGERMTYYMSLQANHDTGLLNVPKSYSYDSNQNRWSYILQNNLSYDLTNSTTIALRMNTQIGSNSGPGYSTTDLFTKAYYVDPVTFPAYFPARKGDTHIRFGNAVITGSNLYSNPYADMVSSNRKENFSTINASVDLKQKLDFITKGLEVKLLTNYKSYNSVYYERTIEPYFYRVMDGFWNANQPDSFELQRLGSSGTDFISQSDLSRSSNYTFYLDGRLNWARTFSNHNISAMFMYMMREERGAVLPHRNQGYSARITYDYMQKYLVEFNAGYTGTERLKDHRFEFFPAISLGWVASSEDFWKPLQNVVSFLKVRGSYGLVGSDETGADAGAPHFLYINEVNIGKGGGFSTGDLNEIVYNGPAFGNYAVEDAHWERVKKLDIGFDMELFRQVNITFDYFHDKRDRILMRRGSWPAMMGYWNGVPWSNIGRVTNKGFDLSVNWNTKFSKDFIAELRFNMTYNKNRYDYVDEPDYYYVWQTKTGKPISRITGYVAEGLFKNQDDVDMSPRQELGGTVMPGDIKYRDINGDGQITSEDQVMISEYGSTPTLQYGLGINLNWKNFDFGVFFTGSGNRKQLINDLLPFGTSTEHGNKNVFQFVADDYWSESNPNPNATFPRLGYTTQQMVNNEVPSTYWLRDMSYVRWKTLEIGYTFPNARVYISGDNLAVWSKFKLWDPAIWWNTYPLSRTWNLGVQLNF